MNATIHDHADQSALLNSVLTDAEKARRGEMLAALFGVDPSPEFKSRQFITSRGWRCPASLFTIVERIIREGK